VYHAAMLNPDCNALEAIRKKAHLLADEVNPISQCFCQLKPLKNKQIQFNK
jgi:hypothetical protein